MNFVLLCDEQQVTDARSHFPLFYDGCLPASLFEGELCQGTRFALVCDVDNTVLAVLQQRFPYHGSQVSVTSLVVASLSGMHRFLRFMRRFLTEVHPWVSSINVPIHMIPVFTQNGVSMRDIDQALVAYKFRLRSATTTTTTTPNPETTTCGDAADTEDMELDPGESPVP